MPCIPVKFIIRLTTHFAFKNGCQRSASIELYNILDRSENKRRGSRVLNYSVNEQTFFLHVYVVHTVPNFN